MILSNLYVKNMFKLNGLL